MVNRLTWLHVDESVVQQTLKSLGKLKQPSSRSTAGKSSHASTLLRNNLATASEDGTCRVWETIGVDASIDMCSAKAAEKPARPLRCTPLHPGTYSADVVTVVAHPSSSELVTACSNGLVKVWDVHRAFPVSRAASRQQSGHVHSVVLRPVEFTSETDQLLVNLAVYSHTGNRILVQMKNPAVACIFHRNMRTMRFGALGSTVSDSPRLERCVMLTLPAAIYKTTSAAKLKLKVQLTNAVWTADDSLVVTAHVCRTFFVALALAHVCSMSSILWISCVFLLTGALSAGV